MVSASELSRTDCGHANYRAGKAASDRIVRPSKYSFDEGVSICGGNRWEVYSFTKKCDNLYSPTQSKWVENAQTT